MPKLILGLTGLAGSGKGTIGDMLQTRYGATFLTFSSYLSSVLDTLALERSRDNQIKMSECLRATFGEDALSHAITRDALAAQTDLVVMDGIRRVGDIVNELEPLPQFRLAAVDADPRTRYERITSRGEKTDEKGMSWEAFLAQDQRSTEVSILETMARATLRISNNGTPKELEKELDVLMNQFGISKRV